MNLNCCIHSPALAAVKKQQQKPETNGVLIFSRSCQLLSLLLSLRHCATRQPWRVPVSRDGYTAFWDKRRLGTCIKYEACRPNGLPVYVCVCVPRPPAHVWVATVGCVCRLSIKKWNKSQMALPSPRPEKYASVFVFYSYNNKSTVAASSGTVTAKTTAAAVAVSPPLFSSPPSRGCCSLLIL